MADLVFIVIVVAFFALCVGYVRSVRPHHRAGLARCVSQRLAARRRAEEVAVMTVLFASQAVDNYVGLALAVCLLVLLVARPRVPGALLMSRPRPWSRCSS